MTDDRIETAWRCFEPGGTRPLNGICDCEVVLRAVPQYKHFHHSEDDPVETYDDDGRLLPSRTYCTVDWVLCPEIMEDAVRRHGPSTEVLVMINQGRCVYVGELDRDKCFGLVAASEVLRALLDTLKTIASDPQRVPILVYNLNTCRYQAVSISREDVASDDAADAE